MTGQPNFISGPWEILGEDRGFDGVPYYEITKGELGTPTYHDVAHVPANDLETLSPEELATAHLITAGPDLYEAASLALDLLERVGDSRKDAPVIDALRAALAKAEGRP